MSGYISEFFGYRAEDSSVTALDNTSKQVCPFLSSYCTKALGDKTNRTLSGVCAIRQVSEGSPAVICCPNRIYADNYKMLNTIAAAYTRTDSKEVMTFSAPEKKK